MPCSNLKGEMAKKGITIEAIAKLLGIHRNSAANKISGDSSFTIDEAIAIQRNFFPKLTLQYLFKKDESQGNDGIERRQQE